MKIPFPLAKCLYAMAPLIFVFLWSTGFISAKYGLPSAEPFTFLAIRTSIAAVILMMLVPLFNPKWPKQFISFIHICVTGLLIHCVYLGGVFYAIHSGISASISAIIIGLQPLLTALIAWQWLGESLNRRKVFGTILGLIGILMVIGAEGISTKGISYPGIVMCIISLFAISIGTTYQKRYCGEFDLLPMVAIQFIANAIVLIILAFAFETREVIWDRTFIYALTWLVLVLSVGTSLLLLWLIKHGEAGKIGSLFYLVPPFVTIEAWILFNETFESLAIFGMVACVIGVAMVIITPKSNQVKNNG